MNPTQSQSWGFWIIVGGWFAIVSLIALTRKVIPNKPKKCSEELLNSYRKTFERPIEKFPLHADVPRLSRKVFIHTKDSKTLSPPDDTSKAIKQFFLGIAEQLFDWNPKSSDKALELQKILDDTFDEDALEGKDLQVIVRQFIEANSTLLGDSFLAILKTVTQDIVAPGVIQMKKQFISQMPYKDVRGEWYIHISFEHPKHILISHHKLEESFTHNESEKFQFQWNLDLMFDQNMQALMEASLYVPKIQFAETSSPQFQQKIRLLLEDYLI